MPQHPSPTEVPAPVAQMDPNGSVATAHFTRLREAGQRLRAQIAAFDRWLAAAPDSNSSHAPIVQARQTVLEVIHELGAATDEIHHRDTRLQAQHEQLVLAGRFATIGVLATGIAHELNNPLNNIGLFIGNAIDLMEMGPADAPRVFSELRSALEQVRKATEIISHLLTFGRAAPVGLEPVHLHAIILRALTLLDQQFRLRQIQVELDLKGDPVAIGSPTQLEQVFLNLLTNARDALAEARERRIRIRTERHERTVDVHVGDTGPGIPEGLEGRIFDPFFTTKEVGAGTGLGLSITYGIIRDHGGTITVVNRPGEGVEFVIRLPLAPTEGGS